MTIFNAMTDTSRADNLLSQLDHLNEQQLRRFLVEVLFNVLPSSV